MILMQLFSFDQVFQLPEGDAKATLRKTVVRLTTFTDTNASGFPNITS